MSSYSRSSRVLDNVVTATVLTGAADIATWTVVGPITVARIGVLVTVAQSGAQPVIRFDLRPTYGSDVGRLNGKVGSFQFPAGGVGVGKTVSIEVRVKVDAGQQIVAGVVTVGGAGSVIPIIEWVSRTENAANQASAQISGTPIIGLQMVEGQMLPLLDGADPGRPLGLGGGALVLVPGLHDPRLREAHEARLRGEVYAWRELTAEEEAAQIERDADERARRVGEPGWGTGPGPRPFPHQGIEGLAVESPEEQEERQARQDEARQQQIAAREDALLERERRLRESPEERAQRREREQQEREQAREQERQRREQERQAREARAQQQPA